MYRKEVVFMTELEKLSTDNLIKIITENKDKIKNLEKKVEELSLLLAMGKARTFFKKTRKNR